MRQFFWHKSSCFGTNGLTRLGGLRGSLGAGPGFQMKSLAVAGLLVVSSAFATEALFPTPLHVVRRIEDPLARSTVTLDQFCYGNRIVTVTASRVAIEDFGEQTLTEIDHARMTYSITKFDDIAKAQRPSPKESATKHNVQVNHSVTLSRDALEALIGAAFPNRRTKQHDDVVVAARSARGGRIVAQSAAETFGLPNDESITYENGLTSRNIVVRVDADLPPPATIVIDPGATRVESRLTRLHRELEQLDRLPSQHP